LPRFWDDSRALILPSIWYENQTPVILEAFAAGKTSHRFEPGRMKELAKPEERGLLFEAGMPANWQPP
jgi:glycosyltransferase involved in cell wall biosynthesis